MAAKKSKPAPVKKQAAKPAAKAAPALPSFGPSSADVERLAKLLEKTGLVELEYREGDKRLRLSRSGGAVAYAAAPVAAPAPIAAPVASAAAAPAAEPSLENAVTSPMVGTAYLSPEPSAPAFVRVGDKVKEGQTLLIVEAMKVMNPIRSPRSGTVARIIVQNGAPVEYGEALIVIE